MSYTSTYNSKTPTPKGVGLAIGVHAVVIATVIAMPGIEILPKIEGELKGFHIPEPKPPKPTVKPPDPKVQTPRNRKIETPRPRVDTLPKAPDETSFRFAGGNESLISDGTGSGIEIPFDPIDVIELTADPVIIRAKLNPRFTAQFQPRYPSGRLRLDEEGVVAVRVLVGRNGRAKDIELISAPHADFWQATRGHALKKWRFKPATKDGKAIESWITLKVRFEINT